MSLLYDAFEDVVLMERTRIPDGEGGWTTTYKDGAKFQAAITLDSSLQAQVAEKQGVKGIYTITTPKSITLEFHDVVRRERDGKIFRVTTDGDDKHTPDSATFQIRQVRAEEWVIPV